MIHISSIINDKRAECDVRKAAYFPTETQGLWTRFGEHLDTPALPILTTLISQGHNLAHHGYSKLQLLQWSVSSKISDFVAKPNSERLSVPKSQPNVLIKTSEGLRSVLENVEDSNESACWYQKRSDLAYDLFLVSYVSRLCEDALGLSKIMTDPRKGLELHVIHSGRTSKKV